VQQEGSLYEVCYLLLMSTLLWCISVQCHWWCCTRPCSVDLIFGAEQYIHCRLVCVLSQHWTVVKLLSCFWYTAPLPLQKHDRLSDQ